MSGCVYNELGVAMVQGFNVAKKKNIRYAELQYFQQPILLKLQAMKNNFFSVWWVLMAVKEQRIEELKGLFLG